MQCITEKNEIIPGQEPALQASVSVVPPAHCSPPFAADVASVLVRVLVPPPHFTLQSLQSP